VLISLFFFTEELTLEVSPSTLDKSWSKYTHIYAWIYAYICKFR